jgi:hypothetical protein
MNLPTHTPAGPLYLDISGLLTVGRDAGNGVSLAVDPLYVWGLLIGGPVLVLAGILLVKIRYARAKYFAMEFGNGSFFGRLKAVFHFIVLGTLMLLLGCGATWVGWQMSGYSVTLTAAGLTETLHAETTRYAWENADLASERIKSTGFWISFTKAGRKCRVSFQQSHIGEALQDKAIAISENALSAIKVPRSQE